MDFVLTELWVEVEELIRRGARAVFLQGHLNDVEPEHSQGFMIAARRQVGDVVGGVVSANTSAELAAGGGETEPHQINIGQLHVGAMMPLIERKGARFKLAHKLVVVHAVL